MEFDTYQMRAMQESLQSEDINKKKTEQMIARINEFQKVKTLEEAKLLAKKILPTTNEVSTFNRGNAKCTVVNKYDIFRITLDSPEEFISYDFSK